MKKIIGLTRVSTKEQGKTKNGLEAQEAAIRAFAEYNGYEVLEIITEVVSGAAELEDRPGLAAAIAKAAKSKDTYVVVNKLDRLSRDAAFILNLMKTKARFIVTELGEDVDPFMLHIYAAVAEKERITIGMRTRAALAAKKARGEALGASVTVLAKATAKSNEAVSAKADAFAAKIMPNLSRMLAKGMTLREMAEELNASGTKTARGGLWYPTTVKNIVDRVGVA